MPPPTPKENVIPDDAVIKLNIRTFDEGVRARVLAAVERIVKAEASFLPERVQEVEPTSASEDFGCLGKGWDVPSVFWFGLSP
jgi:hippurate hydrolase